MAAWAAWVHGCVVSAECTWSESIGWERLLVKGRRYLEGSRCKLSS